ncbi:HpcH/HpaI aldolase/citrate lyase [Cryptococcus neoformans var. grubii H99]|uniref:HpcH/HpaI aldolase/citrate lyase n=1 Tax=Cryptococcus neoformans (strain H99 / ATCC 208821 / CBS 10515 / FGSC 9487) TaxID=235443 RepID=J9VSC2_CRYN9|nr:HpcH/HpaI aldolase/citrate lyase [Cryptococcus neoformans var. grubii H99]AFR94605.1 HpcH/HpaI aldolase/citrate lyase [Cryptococcus neoformans var. grubii H99]AUB24286.1 HpcH/HpaI aldolase/citrate lyase family protein [Cryptococcus neoformans var. grubii]|eukprot:XP_012049613.1 HpcH/HpaI aldolase/citrate lyase [Cryptococcus neoformans var. grubii H99]
MPLSINGSPLRRALAEGRPALGVTMVLPGALHARILASLPNLSYIFVDLEHGAMSDTEMQAAIQAIVPFGVSPIVRIPAGEPWMIKRALDAGAHGIAVPMVSTPEEAAAIASAARFPPNGCRGFGSTFSRDAFGWTSDAEYLEKANNEILVAVMIETKQGYENAEAIINTPGIDIIMTGETDICLSMGYPLTPDNPAQEVTAAISHISSLARKANKWQGGRIRPSTGGPKAMASRGIGMIQVGVDAWLLREILNAKITQAMES